MTKSVLAKTESGEIQLTITIPATLVKKAYNQLLDKAVKEVEIPGFRKGKAPKKLAEEKIDKAKIYEQILQKIVPHAYLEALKEHNLNPIIVPKVELLKAKEGEDWEIRATTCERPEIDLGDYKEEVRKALAPTKIWTPGQKPPTTEAQKSKENTEEEKTQKVIQILLQTVKIDLPAILVEDELNRALANLINQTERLGLTIDQYFSSIGKSADQLRTEYRNQIESDLKLRFILDEVAGAEKLEVSPKEIDDLIATTGDEKLKQSLNLPPQREYLKGVLRRRKALDFLGKL